MRSIGADDERFSGTASWVFDLVVPRPIALVSTVGTDGLVNLAPFAFYNAVSHTPPMISIAPDLRDGELKDTARNIRESGEFVVHVVTEDLLDVAIAAGAELAAHESEVERGGWGTVPSSVVSPPRLAAAAAAMECRAWEWLTLPSGRPLIVAEVVLFHVAEDLADAPANLRAMGRIGGGRYVSTRHAREP